VTIEEKFIDKICCYFNLDKTNEIIDEIQKTYEKTEF